MAEYVMFNNVFDVFDKYFFWLIFGVILLFFLSGLMYKLFQYMKGTVTISLMRNQFSIGDEIKGSAQIFSKKDIQANKIVSRLVCQELQRRGKSSTWVDIYSEDVALDGTRKIAEGSTARYDFTFKAPPRDLIVKTFSENSVARFFQRAFDKKRRWMIRVIVDAKGIDLTGEKLITFSGSSQPGS